MPRLTLHKTHFWPPDLYARLEAIAVHEGRAVQTILEECVEIGLHQKDTALLFTHELAAAYDRHLAIAAGAARGQDSEFRRWLQACWTPEPPTERPPWHPDARSDSAGPSGAVHWYVIGATVWGFPVHGGGCYRVSLPADLPPVALQQETLPSDRDWLR